MTERIVYIKQPSDTIIKSKAYKKLGQLDKGILATISDETLLATTKKTELPQLLYFSPDSYENAIRELSPAEVEDALRKRLHWSEGLLNHAWNWLFRRERRNVAWAAVALDKASEKKTAQLETQFADGLNILARLTGENRYEVVKLTDMLDFVLEGESELIRRLSWLASKPLPQPLEITSDLRQSLEQTIETRRCYLREIGEILKQLGRPEFANYIPPPTGVGVVLFVTPRDNTIIRRFQVRRQNYVEWQEGVVAVWKSNEVADLKKRGKRITVLFLDKGDFRKNLFQLTKAQQYREFRQRYSEGEEKLQPVSRIWEHFNTLHLNQVLLKLNTLVRARDTKETSVVSLLEKQMAEEMAALRSRLASHPSWLEPSATATFAGLQDAEKQWTLDAALFAKLAQRMGDAFRHQKFTALVESKR